MQNLNEGRNNRKTVNWAKDKCEKDGDREKVIFAECKRFVHYECTMHI